MLTSCIGDGTRAMSPQVVKLYVNTVCNARCVMCDIGQKNRNTVFHQQVVPNAQSVLTVEACRRLMDEVARFKPRINIHGLEPLLHPQLPELIYEIKARGLAIHLVTNGILLSHAADDLVRLGVDIITVSLDGPRQIHDAIRGDGVFDQAMEGIRLLRSRREVLRQKKVKITTAFTISNFNAQVLTDYADVMLGEERIDAVNFLFMSYVTQEASRLHNNLCRDWSGASQVNTGAVKPEGIDVDGLWDQIQTVTKKYRRGRVYFNHNLRDKSQLQTLLKYPEKHAGNTRCTIPWKSTTILANGDAIINNRCFAYVAGNIHSQSLLDIWNGERYRDFRRRLKKAQYFPACLRCCGSYRGG